MKTIQALKLDNPIIKYNQLLYKGLYCRGFLSHSYMEMFLLNGGIGKLIYTK